MQGRKDTDRQADHERHADRQKDEREGRDAVLPQSEDTQSEEPRGRQDGHPPPGEQARDRGGQDGNAQPRQTVQLQDQSVDGGVDAVAEGNQEVHEERVRPLMGDHPIAERVERLRGVDDQGLREAAREQDHAEREDACDDRGPDNASAPRRHGYVGDDGETGDAFDLSGRYRHPASPPPSRRAPPSDRRSPPACRRRPPGRAARP